MKRLLSFTLFSLRGLVMLTAFLLLHGTSRAGNITVNLGVLDGSEVNSRNVFDFQVINNSNYSGDALIRGTLRYRNSPLQFNYSFHANLHSGLNQFSNEQVSSPTWNFSSNAFKELFFNYNKLPEGTYEYCITVDVKSTNPENISNPVIDGCTYYTVNDIFLINLIEPENNAKIYELYPMLSWVVNYPFASELTYRIRVAELKHGQNNQNAITRNPPMYEDKNVLTTGVTYPMTAKPLQKFQPYVWTVDAYYKGILLGGAEVWKFTIIEDTLLKVIPKEQPYVELNIENGGLAYYAIGSLKLKYLENAFLTDTLHMSLTDEKGKQINLRDSAWIVNRGDNRKVLALEESANLKHMKEYILTVKGQTGNINSLRFKYVNPIYIKE